MDVRLSEENLISQSRVGNNTLLPIVLQRTLGNMQCLADLFLCQSFVWLQGCRKRGQMSYPATQVTYQRLEFVVSSRFNHFAFHTSKVLSETFPVRTGRMQNKAIFTRMV